MSQQPKHPAAHTEERFHSEEAARTYLESVRWPKGAICPHCGGVERNSRITPQSPGKGARPGLWFCGDCRSQFTVTVGTVFEDSHVPLHKWVYANHLICSSKKGISSKQLERVLKVSYKTAWFMSHRLRHGMKSEPTGQLGGSGKIVEVDETYYGRKRGQRARAQGSGAHKHRIFSLVERNGQVRSFHVPSVSANNLKPIMRANIDQRSHINTDEATRYWRVGKEFAQHSTVNHAIKEYARGVVTTNSAEGFFSILKRGLTGIYQCVSEQHLQRYVDEFDFRYNYRQSQGFDDEQRAIASLKGIEGKRLSYRPTDATPQN
jgi:transposase-like protein